MKELLEKIEGLSPDVPGSLLAEARDLGKTGGEIPGVRKRDKVKTLVAVMLGAVVLGLTPPGQAAADWFAEITGIREEPSLPQVGFVEGSQSAIGEGQLGDNTRFEIVVRNPKGKTPFREYACFQIDWIDLQEKSGGGMCTKSTLDGKGNKPALESAGVFFPPTGGRPEQREGPALYFGIADSNSIEAVEIELEDSSGVTTRPATLLTVDGEALESIGGTYPVSVFAAEFGVDEIAAIRSGNLIARAVGRDAAGAEVSEAPTLVSGTQPEVELQKQIRSGETIPRELRRVVPLTKLDQQQRELLAGFSWEGASLKEAQAEFDSRPEVQKANKDFRDLLKKQGIRRPPPGVPGQIGAAVLENGELVYFVAAAGFSQPQYAGIYAASDLTEIFFGTISPGSATELAPSVSPGSKP